MGDDDNKKHGGDDIQENSKYINAKDNLLKRVNGDEYPQVSEPNVFIEGNSKCVVRLGWPI